MEMVKFAERATVVQLLLISSKLPGIRQNGCHNSALVYAFARKYRASGQKAVVQRLGHWVTGVESGDGYSIGSLRRTWETLPAGGE